MKITFALKRFADGEVNAHYLKHFLLDKARLEVTLVFADSDEKVFVPPKRPDGSFLLDLGPNEIPDIPDPAGPPQKKRITRLSMDFFVTYAQKGRTFQLLKIRQDFSLKELPTNTSTNIEYQLSPFSWRHSANPRLRTANANVHPLVDLSKLRQNVIGLNALVLDVTELWDFLHEENWIHQVYKELSDTTKITFKVFAHLGGSAFIWYCVVPSYLASSSKIAPHVFYPPGDYGPQQNIVDEKQYLQRNDKQFQAQTEEPAEERARRRPGSSATQWVASSSEYNGDWLLLGYLLPPVDDDKIEKLNPRDYDKKELIDWVKEVRRNVVNFERMQGHPRQIRLQHWNIGAGFEKAFYALAKIKPQQLLLIPQVYGRNGRAVKGIERTSHLKNVTDTIVDLLQTNTELVGAEKDELVAKDKMILSCYSESGLDLWRACNSNIDQVKAIIGIEPKETFTEGTRKTITELLKRKVQVFIIGRHKGGLKPSGDLYRPKISPDLMKQIRFLPDDLKIFKYPPDPASNKFVELRVARVTGEKPDPFMLDNERDLLNDLGTGGQPIKGDAAIKAIFQPASDYDDPGRGALVDIYYRHNFALTGGQEMSWEGDQFYGKDAGKVTYRTFFQQAVEEIG